MNHLTFGQVESWQWERVWGRRVPQISLREKMEWTRLRRATWLTPYEAKLSQALERKVRFRRDQLKNLTLIVSQGAR